MTLGPVRKAIAELACTLAGHRFVVWARTCEAPPRHPHLGAWARCARCGEERDWRVGSGGLDERVLDLVHGVVRPMHELQAIARGERAPEPAVAVSAPVAHVPPARPIRRRSTEGRSSSRRAPRDHEPRDHEPRDR